MFMPSCHAVIVNIVLSVSRHVLTVTFCNRAAVCHHGVLPSWLPAWLPPQQPRRIHRHNDRQTDRHCTILEPRQHSTGISSSAATHHKRPCVLCFPDCSWNGVSSLKEGIWHVMQCLVRPFSTVSLLVLYRSQTKPIKYSSWNVQSCFQFWNDLLWSWNFALNPITDSAKIHCFN